MKTKHFSPLILPLSFYSNSFSKRKNELINIAQKTLTLKSTLAPNKNTIKFDSKLLAFTKTILNSTLKVVKIKASLFTISKP